MSLTLWPQKLEESYVREQQDGLAGALQETIDQMVQFYEPVNYSPFLVRGFGDERTLAASPVRTRNSLKVLLESCTVQRPEGCDVAVIFDFTGPNQMDALVEVGTILFIVLLMAVTSFDLQNVVDRKLVKPLEGMLHHVRENAAHIFDRFAKQTEGTEGAELDDEELQDQQGGASEIELIQAILEKLARLASLAESSNKAYTPAELDAMNAENKAVLIDMLNVQVLQSSAQSKLGGKRNTKADLHATWTQNWNLDFLESTLEGNPRLRALHVLLVAVRPRCAVHGRRSLPPLRPNSGGQLQRRLFDAIRGIVLPTNVKAVEDGFKFKARVRCVAPGVLKSQAQGRAISLLSACGGCVLYGFPSAANHASWKVDERTGAVCSARGCAQPRPRPFRQNEPVSSGDEARAGPTVQRQVPFGKHALCCLVSAVQRPGQGRAWTSGIVCVRQVEHGA